ncbi:MAG TPA: hypothetical protein P5530_01215 [Candidatus Diapherotrites archaeon]|nr:hypothetical protein [Candidatus Diapherotrites archaeon]
MIKPKATKPRIYLKARKAITGKRAKPSELGYKRNPKTGKLTKPGTRAFNEKLAFTEQNRDLLLSEYRSRIIEAKNAKKNAKSLSAHEQNKIDRQIEIYKQKIVDIEKKYNYEISNKKRQRTHDLEVAERRRLTAIKKRQLKYKISKIDALLSVSNKPTINSTLQNLITDIFQYELKKVIAKSKNKPVPSDFLEKYTDAMNEMIYSRLEPSKYNITNKVTTEFYREFNKAVSAIELESMTPRDAQVLVSSITKSIKRKYFV